MADLPIPQIINSLDVDEDKAYEPPYAIRWGGATGRPPAPSRWEEPSFLPGGATASITTRIATPRFTSSKGRSISTTRTETRLSARETPQGHFVYFPLTCIHGQENPSHTEVAELIFTYGAMPNKEAAGTTFVDDPRDPLKN